MTSSVVSITPALGVCFDRSGKLDQQHALVINFSQFLCYAKLLLSK